MESKYVNKERDAISCLLNHRKYLKSAGLLENACVQYLYLKRDYSVKIKIETQRTHLLRVLRKMRSKIDFKKYPRLYPCTESEFKIENKTRSNVGQTERVYYVFAIQTKLKSQTTTPEFANHFRLPYTVYHLHHLVNLMYDNTPTRATVQLLGSQTYVKKSVSC
jgi:hypothetical protein